MGIFDDFSDLISSVTEPLKDITETVNQVREDALASMGEISSAASDLKDQGTSAVGDLAGTISDITGKKPNE